MEEKCWRDSNCKKCDYYKCEECEDNYFKFISDINFEKREICLKNEEGCLSSIDYKGCIKCKDNYFLYPPSFMNWRDANPKYRICYYNYTCKTFSDNIGCISCKDNQYFFNNYYDIDLFKGPVLCGDTTNCKTWENYIGCTSCNKNYILRNYKKRTLSEDERMGDCIYDSFDFNKIWVIFLCFAVFVVAFFIAEILRKYCCKKNKTKPDNQNGMEYVGRNEVLVVSYVIIEEKREES